MDKLPALYLSKKEDRRIRAGHLWIFSNEIDVQKTPLKQFHAGAEVSIYAADKSFLGIGYVNPHSLIAARIISRHPNDRLDQTYFKKRISQALTLRNRLFSKPFYRLLFGESDFVPGLVIDRFGSYLVIQANTAGIDNKIDIIVKTLIELMPETKGILLKNDSSARRLEHLEENIMTVYGEIPSFVQLEENDAVFYAPLQEGQKTGWFYDHRSNRARLASYVNGQRVLDVFSYLGGWGIQAAMSGAKQVTCLDSSKLSLTWITKNAELNHLSSQMEVLEQDAFIGLKELNQAKENFDVIILDPPAFIKKQKDKKEGLLAYQRINELALKLLKAEGILISCSCSYHMTDEELMDTVRRAGQRTNSDLQILERGYQAPDHPVHPAIPETHYLKMLIARKL